MELHLPHWKPINTAPTDPDIVVDLWAVDLRSKRGYRITDCHRSYDGAWIEKNGKWVSGKYFYNEEGDRCFDPGATCEESIIVTHWALLPEPPG